MLLKKLLASVMVVRQLWINFVARFSNKETLRLAIIGGSNSVMRTGYANYLNTLISKSTARLTTLSYYALGGLHSIYAPMQEDRCAIGANNDVIFFEYCVNDRYAIEKETYSLDLAGKALEGFIRKVHASNPRCLIVILLFRHLDHFYDDDNCQLYELSESIAQKYSLPVVDVTRLLRQTPNLQRVRALYEEDDPSHYSRPHGMETVAQIIASELDRRGVIQDLRKARMLPRCQDFPPIYPDNFHRLAFFDRFDSGKFFLEKTDSSIYQNSVFKEKYFPISQGNSLNFLLKGQLVGLFVKADLDHGFIKIKCNGQSIVTSTYTFWMNPIKPRHAITLVALPLVRFSESLDFVPVSISNCLDYPEDYELEYHKVLPRQQDPRKWKLNIIGIAYIGELKSMDTNNPRVLESSRSAPISR